MGVTLAIDISNGLVQEAHRLMLNYDPEPTHAEQVHRLAVQLFEGIHTYLALPAETLPLLEAAALTHDVGWSIGGRGHHKKSARIIMENKLGTASHREVLVVAALARAHRKNPPAPPTNPLSLLTRMTKPPSRN